MDMIEAIVFLIAWYVTGVIGSTLALGFVGEQECFGADGATLRDVLFGLFIAILGPLNLAVGFLGFFLPWWLGRKINFDKVIIKQRR